MYWTLFKVYDGNGDSGQECFYIVVNHEIQFSLNDHTGGLTSTPIVTLLSKLVDKEEMGAVMAMCSGKVISHYWHCQVNLTVLNCCKLVW